MKYFDLAYFRNYENAKFNYNYYTNTINDHVRRLNRAQRIYQQHLNDGYDSTTYKTFIAFQQHEIEKLEIKRNDCIAAMEYFKSKA